MPFASTTVEPTQTTVSEDFVRDVAGALGHLHDPARLETHPLARRLPVRGQPPETLGRALDRFLRAALEELRPVGRQPPATAGRIHRLLALRYLDGLEPPAVWSQLGIGKSEYYREHGRGVRALASVLWERAVPDGAVGISSRARTLRHPLPDPLTSFIGRDRELSDLSTCLQMARLVTVTGPPGSGKTRLALQLARETPSGLPRSSVFVALAPVATPDDVWSAVAQALGAPERKGVAALDEVIDTLSEQELLLVLDNFEHVLAAGPDLRSLLAACPLLHVIVTSRERLRISGERAYLLSPLDRSDAVRLFVDRARSVRADFHITSDEAITVADICSRVDRLPLAIELAAGRVRLFGTTALLTRLDRRLPVLSGGPRDQPPRHQALRATIAWSYDLLNPAEQSLFRALAVCVGGCSLEAVQAFGDGEVLLVLESLIEKSLLQQENGIDDQPRFRMLQTLREYALERLEESGLETTACHAHATYFRAFAERAELEYSGPSEGACFDLLEQDYANLRAAIEWSIEAGELELGLAIAGALWRFLYHRGHMSDGRDVLRRLLSASESIQGTLPAPVLAKALFAISSLAVWQGDSPAGRTDAESSVALYRTLGDKRGEGFALHTLAHTADHAAAPDLYLESIACLREAGDARGVAWSLQCLGNVKIALGELDEAHNVLLEGLEVARQSQSAPTISGTLTGLGTLAARLGDHARAYQLYLEGFELRRKQSDRAITDQLNVLGRAALDMNDMQLATAHYSDSLRLCREQGIKAGAAFGLAGVAEVAMRGGDAAHAVTLFAAADALLDALHERRSVDDQVRHARILESLAEALGGSAFEAARAAGVAMPRDEAIAYALGGLTA
jgi:predicted ATPase